MKIDRVEIERLRGVRHGVVGDLAPLSILVGPNNCGKSTVLEALVLSSLGGRDFAEAVQFLCRRGGPAHHAMRTLFWDSDEHQGCNMRLVGAELEHSLRLLKSHGRDVEDFARAKSEGLRDDMRSYELHITAAINRRSSARSFRLMLDSTGKLGSPFRASAQGEPLAQFGFVDVDAVRAHGELEAEYSRLERWGKLDETLDALRVSMPDLKDLRILQVEQDFILHITRAGQPPTPAYLAGDGFKRLLALAAALNDGENAVVMLEEPETFLHPRYIRELVLLLHRQIRRGKQVILSTHSLELIDQLLADDEEQPLIESNVHRLRLSSGELRSVTVSARDARTLRSELFEDLRS